MNHGELTQAVVTTSLRLIDQGHDGETTGEAVARELGYDPDSTEIYNAFRAGQDQGLLRCYFGGGMALPASVRRG
jgi:hypothetical protein